MGITNSALDSTRKGLDAEVNKQFPIVDIPNFDSDGVMVKDVERLLSWILTLRDLKGEGTIYALSLKSTLCRRVITREVIQNSINKLYRSIRACSTTTMCRFSESGGQHWA